MHQTVQNLLNIKNEIKTKLEELKYNYLPNIVAVSKTFSIKHIVPIIDYGHVHFGENKVQEALDKWPGVKKSNPNITLHMVVKLQTNKVKFALQIFDFIHSLDNLKLAKKISEEQKKYKVKPKIFIQINIGDEDQKSGIIKTDILDFYNECKNLDLDIVGTMCLPPYNKDTKKFFLEMEQINNKLKFKELSMGMSHDYLSAIEHSASYLRIGSKIFGERS